MDKFEIASTHQGTTVRFGKAIPSTGKRLGLDDLDSIRTSIAHGKIKRQGRYAGQRPDWKKAYVKLREGQKMPEFLEGA